MVQTSHRENWRAKGVFDMHTLQRTRNQQENIPVGYAKGGSSWTLQCGIYLGKGQDPFVL